MEADARGYCACPQCAEQRRLDRESESIRAAAYRLNARADPAEIERSVEEGMKVVEHVREKYPAKRAGRSKLMILFVAGFIIGATLGAFAVALLFAAKDE